MQVYIQQTTSNYLYSSGRGWVQSVLDADVFPTSIDALNFCMKRALPDVHIRVHSSQNPEYDTVFSVSDFPARTKVPPLP